MRRLQAPQARVSSHPALEWRNLFAATVQRPVHDGTFPTPRIRPAYGAPALGFIRQNARAVTQSFRVCKALSREGVGHWPRFPPQQRKLFRGCPVSRERSIDFSDPFVNRFQRLLNVTPLSQRFRDVPIHSENLACGYLGMMLATELANCFFIDGG